MQAEGLEAVFECLFPGAVTYSWLVNGSSSQEQSLSQSSIVAALPSVEFPTARLTLPAIPHYNNTVIQCVAFVFEEEMISKRISKESSVQIQGM